MADVLVFRPPVASRLLLAAAPTALAVVPAIALVSVGMEWALVTLVAFAVAVAGRTAQVRCEARSGELLVVNRFRTRRFRAGDVEEYGLVGLLGVGPAGLSLRLEGSRMPLPFLVEATVTTGTSKGVSRTNCVLREARRLFPKARFVEPS